MEQIKTFNRWVRDPLFSPVKRFLAKRKQIVNQEGDIVDRELAKFRYDNSRVEDFIIEKVLTGPDGVKRICLTNRDRHFARVDMVLTEVTLRECLTDLGVDIPIIMTHEDFIEGFRNGVVQNHVVYLAWKDSLGVCIPNKEAKDLTGVDNVFLNTYFEKMVLNRESEEYIDKKTLISGEVQVTDQAIGSEKVILYISDLIRKELGISDVQHNFPKNITTQRGKQVRHNIKVLVSGEDVTTRATITYSTKNRNLHVANSVNKLEMVVDAIRGNPDADIDDVITVRIVYSGESDNVDITTDINVAILKDTPSELKLYGYPTAITTPDGVELGVVIKASLNGNDVTPSVVPSGLTSMIYPVTLQSRGPQEGGGNLFSGLCNVGVTTGEKRDLLQGVFRYTVGAVTYSATAFIELTVTPAIANYGQLEIVRVQPYTLRGNPGQTRRFDFIVNRLGVVLTNDKMTFPLNKPLGPKKLIRFLNVTPTDVGYEFLVNAGEPGTVISDTVPFEVVHIDANAVIWRGTATVYPESRNPSVITYVPVGTSLPIEANRYDSGRMPFDLLVNGVPSNQLYKLDTINSVDNVMRIDLDGFQSESRAWSYLGRLAEDQLDSPVEFVGIIYVDGVYQTTRYTKKFNLRKFTGPAWVTVPSSVNVEGPENDVTQFTAAIWNEDKRVNKEVQVIPTLSTLSGKTATSLADAQDSYVKFNHIFKKYGDWVDIVAIGKSGANANTAAYLTVNSKIAKPVGLQVTVQTINTWEPYSNNRLPTIVKFDGDVVALTDPKVQTEIEFIGETQSNYVKMPSESTTLIYYVKREAKFSSTIIDFKLTVNFTATDGVVHTKILNGAIDLKRPPITKLTIVPEPDAILPNKVDQRVWFKITDGVKFYEGARVTDINLPPVDQFRNPLKSFKPTMGVLSNNLGRYFFTVTTNHLGGDFWADVQIGIGDAAYKAVSDEYFNIPHKDILGENASKGSGILNVTSTITFDLNQEQLDNPKTPVVMNSYSSLRGDGFYMSSVTDLTMISPGKYSAKVISTGEKGKGRIGFVIVKDDGDPGFTMEWDCYVDVEMI